MGTSGPGGPLGPVGSVGPLGPDGPNGSLGPDNPDGYDGPYRTNTSNGSDGPVGPASPFGRHRTLERDTGMFKLVLLLEIITQMVLHLLFYFINSCDRRQKYTLKRDRLLSNGETRSVGKTNDRVEVHSSVYGFRS